MLLFSDTCHAVPGGFECLIISLHLKVEIKSTEKYFSLVMLSLQGCFWLFPNCDHQMKVTEHDCFRVFNILFNTVLTFELVVVILVSYQSNESYCEVMPVGAVYTYFARWIL